MTTCTLLFLTKDGQVLLAMKKRGFGAGRYNGVGGKVQSEESIEDCMMRECQEEIGVTPLSYEKVAVHEFVFHDTNANNQTHVYVCNAWDGEPIETEEMEPEWFEAEKLPYHMMWQDDSFWLPQILAGKKLHTQFTFDAKDNLLDSKLHEASDLEF
jgi:mutator protein MutT